MSKKKKLSDKAFIAKCKTIGLSVGSKPPVNPHCPIHGKLELMGAIHISRPQPRSSEEQSFSA